MEDRKRKGLCFLCGLKYTPRHKCIKSQLYQFMVETSLEIVEEMEVHTAEVSQNSVKQ